MTAADVATRTDVLAGAERVESIEALGFTCLTTARAAGTFGTNGDDPVRDVMGRWHALRELVAERGARLASAPQVHGARVLTHESGWEGWLRGPEADGHFAREAGTAMAVTVADCVPVFLAHPRGAAAVLHSGWRGTAAQITARAIALFRTSGFPVAELRAHCGPAICGECYEVSADVYGRLTGQGADGPTRVDLRALIASQARNAGVSAISVSEGCTRCGDHRFFSHRAGDLGRQVGLLLAHPSG